MSLRNLPELAAERPPAISAFEPDAAALARWNAGLLAARSDDTAITMLEVIGDDAWSGGGVTAKRIAAALRTIGDRDVTIDLNSPGGDFFEGVAIYNLIRSHPRRVTVRILGLAASAASIIAMAGDEILVARSGFLMLHNAWGLVVGNRHDLDAAARTMAPFDAAMAGVYAGRAGVNPAEAAAWMDAETWFSGEAAIAAGLADALLPADQVARDAKSTAAGARANAVRRIDALLARQNIPRSERRALLSEVKGGTPGAAAATVTQDADDATAVDLVAAITRNILTYGGVR